MKIILRQPPYTPKIGDYCDTIVIVPGSLVYHIFGCNGNFVSVQGVEE